MAMNIPFLAFHLRSRNAAIRESSWGELRRAILNRATASMESPNWSKYTDTNNWSEDDLKFAVTRRDAPYRPLRGSKFNSQRPSTQALLPTLEHNTTLGSLEVLSNEILSQIIDDLELRSLLAFSKTCRLAHYVVETNASYRMVMQYLPRIREILVQTALDPWVPLRALRTELEWPYCRDCKRNGSAETNGPLLYVPTCERVCYKCLRENYGFWLIKAIDACNGFALNIEDLQKIPYLICTDRVIPQGKLKIVEEEHILIPIKCAILAAMRKWGTIAECFEQAENISPDRGRFPNPKDKITGNMYRYFREQRDFPEYGWVHSQPIVTSFDCSTTRFPRNAFPEPQDTFYGWAHVEMPYVKSFLEGTIPATSAGAVNGASSIGFLYAPFI
ncbi:hypothetical protein N7468_009437 [Penicillium chermesinum]|uniref:F-box domain-containing protein n=1 Tax=Penicillium chermesinum TaxID=63820 RepID=A0A9W9TF03_9EURO|nr:uncharacterized protein N7468_009437 [Penicillium chermesinum]KAJ5220233.1 hypothetical protein N7468_009437 [Penicillium chermesinum]